ncbi:hypothetical protein [Oxalicibacterium faecigallinarum]|uniref:hypothetical protein n=1 Tax=Oxalicibacterium faecigallinarum TaxID=573741 RepID=UPI001666CA90|nr:hypothetical protein [Oxalicibacterium faecigallinarum]
MLRKLFIISIICFLPLQMVWAAAGNYCSHEEGSASQHFGHHDHVHKSSESGDSKSTKAKVDPDCGYHSHAGFLSVPITSQSLPLLSFNDSPSTETIFHIQSLQSSLERPKWSAAFTAAS